ncbi:peptide chain release factor N(5)-glutamine methyltransferase [Erythrobacter sp. SCSIO 43205]|uniref:peptide chain release factor N(5)-glutamine methyltransferase n=1 Tax=Erythrobacter sp. SCSIO 43205 TaxID=2779361 RepID=UPI001CA8A70D|nr:peptide chain release factor N(5)-glutamine methyltransferase [Erythrobacter sp. SCSIO 43205]UAB78279.1 peptide chain release factor N(5)-glutamine methyltransferase [Erythrobacter sp. SCSIO 43205]
MSVAEAIRAAAAKLGATSDTARLDAELLMAHALKVSRSDMLLRHMADPAPVAYGDLIARRTTREPVAHITGNQEFYGRDFSVTPDTLIPRGDSEVLIDAALEYAPEARRVLDLGTGTGALLVTALLELKEASGCATDKSSAALKVAERNARALGLDETRAQFTLRDWTSEGWADDLGQFDLILCNPPYVEDAAVLDPDVREFEPASALFAGAEGLDDYRILLPQMRGLMTENAIAVFEIGAAQSKAVTTIAKAHGFDVTVRNDLAGRPRALILR